MPGPYQLFEALRDGKNTRVAEIIKEHGDFTKVVDGSGWTAIHFAAMEGNVPVLQTIWKKWKPPIGQKDKDGWTALHLGNMGCRVSKGGIQN